MITETLYQVMMLKQLFPMAFRSERLKTFEGVESLFSVEVNELAKNGFFYAGTGEKPDATACFYCHGKLHSWEQHDDVAKEHRRLLPHCPVFGDPTYGVDLGPQTRTQNLSANL